MILNKVIIIIHVVRFLSTYYVLFSYSFNWIKIKALRYHPKLFYFAKKIIKDLLSSWLAYRTFSTQLYFCLLNKIPPTEACLYKLNPPEPSMEFNVAQTTFIYSADWSPKRLFVPQMSYFEELPHYIFRSLHFNLN